MSSFAKVGSLALKGTMTWSDRYMAIDTSDGNVTLRIYASESSFDKGQTQSERVIVGAREMGTRRTSIVGVGRGTRHVGGRSVWGAVGARG